jgi:hypothetical protein
MLEIELHEDHIFWHCPACQDAGVVTGWKGSIWDMSMFYSIKPS